MSKGKSFEEQIENLEQIVKELETGKLSLEDSVSKFEEGIKISKECNKTLEEAEKKITILLKQEDGETKEENFENEWFYGICAKQVHLYTVFFMV